MRLPLLTSKKRRRRAGSTAGSKRKRRNHTATGGPVASTEYVGTRRSRRNRPTSAARTLPRAPRTGVIMRRVILTVLLCAALGLITATYRGGVRFHKTQLAVLEVVAPIERGLNRAWDPLVSGWVWTGRLFTAMKAVPKLEQENADLRTALRIAKTYEADNKQLRSMLHMSETQGFPGGFSPVYARVFSRSTGSTDRSVLLNVGTRDGVRQNDPVMVADGLIGRVMQVTKNTARVGLILDSTQHVTVKIVGSDGGMGVLEPISTDGVPALRVQFVEQSAKVRTGDMVVTAGFTDNRRSLKSLYPHGIPVGEVVSAGNTASDMYKVIQIVPYANFSNIDRVIVLTAKNPGAAP